MDSNISITELAEDLQQRVEFQKTPRTFDEDDYISMVKYGLKRLLIDTGRASMYSNDLFFSEKGTEYFGMPLKIDEIEYAIIMARIRFFEMVRADVNEMVSYTTDALSVTQGDKPYANITGTIKELEQERRIVYYKMVPYTIKMD